ncbi:hypothetical protein [Rhodococcoides fascians]|uniref:hypothetical protein n=1 Tax=Rhodococcoides fascians TaxID=1828 RepID=UPI0005607A6E|nr:hypothetical protein [Rhodococcus fascians]
MTRYRVFIQATVTTSVDVEADDLDHAADLAEAKGPLFLIDGDNRYMPVGTWEADMDDIEEVAA